MRKHGRPPTGYCRCRHDGLQKTGILFFGKAFAEYPFTEAILHHRILNVGSRGRVFQRRDRRNVRTEVHVRRVISGDLGDPGKPIKWSPPWIASLQRQNEKPVGREELARRGRSVVVTRASENLCSAASSWTWANMFHELLGIASILEGLDSPQLAAFIPRRLRRFGW